MFIIILLLLFLLEVFALLCLTVIFFFLLKFLPLWLGINEYLDKLKEVIRK